MKPGCPHAGTRLPPLLAKWIKASGKTQAEIATEAGFKNPSMLASIKRGAASLPLRRVVPLSKALDVDTAYLWLLALEQALGEDHFHEVMKLMNNAVTRNELDHLLILREASDLTDPPLTERARAAIRKLFGK